MVHWEVEPEAGGWSLRLFVDLGEGSELVWSGRDKQTNKQNSSGVSGPVLNFQFNHLVPSELDKLFKLSEDQFPQL